jgi:acyl-coenzyme A synthetase/AMP-(fatty) acid ligase/acyl carrier protein
MIEHLNLLNYVLYGERYYLNKNFETGGSYAHLTYTFDASITSLFVPLISGKKVVLAPDSTHDIFTDPTFRQNAPYDFIKITPGQIPLLEQGSVSPEFQLTKRIIIGGEQLHYDQIGPLLTQFEGIEIINEYGPTEATVGCCTYSVFAGNQNNVAEGSVVPVGKPIDNVKIYILDVKGEPVPIGVTGEIYISGSQVARGYLNNQKLTEEKFIVNTFTEGKLYKTGDFGKWLPDGNIVFIGRADEQVKIRGYRIELAEIEHTLRKIQGVQDAKVISSTRQSTTAAVLIGFVVLTHSGKLAGKPMDSLANEKERVVALQNALGNLIPNYMMLHEIVIVDQIPLTREGKVDRMMLLSKLTKVTSSENMRPLTELEVQLCEIWKQLLGLDSINVKDDFFELGGDSLLSIQLISRIRKNLNAEISISTFFELNTIENLARFIELNHRPDVEIGGFETVRL